MQYEYDGLGRVLMEYYQDASGKATYNRWGYQAKRYTRDLLDRVLEENYLLADGVTKVDSVMGYANVSYAYDQHGNVVTQVYYGADGWGAANEQGVNRIERRYDADGSLISEIKYDLGMRPIQKE